MTPFTEAQVSAAARALSDLTHPHVRWEECTEQWKESRRVKARAALTAATRLAPEVDDNQVVPTPSQLMAQNDSLRGKVGAAEGVVGAAEKMRHERTDVFGECLSDYERLRGYVAKRYGDMDADPRTVGRWMADNGYGLFVEGVPEADAWRERFWP